MEAKAKIKNVYMSPKYSREIAIAIKGMSITKVRKYLQDIIDLKKPVVLRRFNKEVPHHFGKPGRFPQKVARQFNKLIDNGVSNAVYRGADESQLIISDAHVTRGYQKKTPGAKAIGKAKQRGRRANVTLTLYQDDKTLKPKRKEKAKKITPKPKEKTVEKSKTETNKATEKTKTKQVTKTLKAGKKKSVTKTTITKKSKTTIDLPTVGRSSQN